MRRACPGLAIGSHPRPPAIQRRWRSLSRVAPNAGIRVPPPVTSRIAAILPRLRCLIEGIAGTLTLPAFWRSGGLVTYSGHVSPLPVWGAPEPSRHPDAWAGLVQYDYSRCERCGAAIGDGWRKWWAS